MESNKWEIKIKCTDSLKTKVKRNGTTSGRVYVPSDWVDCEVLIVKLAKDVRQ